MTSKQWFGASFLVIAGSVVFMMLFAFTGKLMYEFSFQEEELAEETTIAGVQVGEMRPEEAEAALQERIETFEENVRYELTWFDEQIPLPREAVSFHTGASVGRAAEDGSQETAAVSVDEEALREAVASFSFNSSMEEAVRLDELAAQIEEEAGALAQTDYSWMLHPHLHAHAQPAEDVLTAADRSMISEEMAQLLQQQPAITIPGNSDVSVMESLGLHDYPDMDEASLAALGSAVFEAVAPTNFTIEERHIRHTLLDHVPAGFDAHLSPGRKDFAFGNPNDYDYELQLEVTGGTLQVELYGYAYPHAINVDVMENGGLTAATRIRYTAPDEDAAGFDAGQGSDWGMDDDTGFDSSFEDETSFDDDGSSASGGSEGMLVETIRTIFRGDSTEDEDTIVLAEDYYAPVHALESRSISVREPEEEEEEDLEPDDEWDFPWEHTPENGFDSGDNRFNGGDDSFDGGNGFDGGEGSFNGDGGFDEGDDFFDGDGDFDGGDDFFDRDGDFDGGDDFFDGDGGFDGGDDFFDGGSGFDGGDDFFDGGNGNGFSDGNDFDSGSSGLTPEQQRAEQQFRSGSGFDSWLDQGGGEAFDTWAESGTPGDYNNWLREHGGDPQMGIDYTGDEIEFGRPGTFPDSGDGSTFPGFERPPVKGDGR
ncbi:VanW family protein [Bacillus daqingensis]|uniref:VanW family protein n=1 Tax=Bacillus daqingensis TaxID=872396 RepID=A0ABV9NVW1_9BACI